MRTVMIAAVFAASLAAGYLLGTRLPVWVAVPVVVAAALYARHRLVSGGR
ncbi:MAG TPA: hypothetical protein VL426_00305 [Candidatus Binatia bacterium]|jgi:hypothetical protein|nr:hypothetical protein [Candidatus Binatia bacterium]